MKRKKRQIRVINYTEIRDLLKALWPKREDGMVASQILYIVLASFAGLRGLEVQKLTWDCIDLEKSRILLPQWMLKTGSRIVPIENNLRQFLVLFQQSAGPILERPKVIRSRVLKMVGVGHYSFRMTYLLYSFAHTFNKDQLASSSGFPVGRLDHLEKLKPDGAKDFWAITPSSLEKA